MSEKTPATKRKKPAASGRKPGVKNKPRTEVLHIPSSCRNCGSTDFTVERIVESMEFTQIVEGKLYTRTTLRDVRCKKCKHYARERMLENVPQ